MSSFSTVPALAKRLSRETGRHLPAWKIRRVVDGLPGELPRVGQTRLVPESLVPAVIAALRQQSWLPAEEVASG